MQKADCYCIIVLRILKKKGKCIMKFGMRTPSIKKSISARTTGKIERAVKSSVNPLYGEKGMGYINDPEKAVYNKVYNKTSFGVGDLFKFFKK